MFFAACQNSRSLSFSRPAIELPELSHEFDQVVDGTQVTHDFIIRNTGNGPLTINEVKTG